MAVNAIDLAEELQARTDLGARNATGIAHAITRAVEAATSQLVTRDQLDARTAELRADISDLRAEMRTAIADLRAKMRTEIASVRKEIADLRTEIHQLIRAQTLWMTTTMIGTAGLIIAAIKLLP
jgi:ribosomal protein L29